MIALCLVCCSVDSGLRGRLRGFFSSRCFVHLWKSGFWRIACWLLSFYSKTWLGSAFEQNSAAVEAN